MNKGKIWPRYPTVGLESWKSMMHSNNKFKESLPSMVLDTFTLHDNHSFKLEFSREANCFFTKYDLFDRMEILSDSRVFERKGLKHEFAGDTGSLIYRIKMSDGVEDNLPYEYTNFAFLPTIGLYLKTPEDRQRPFVSRKEILYFPTFRD
ncbi:hypothetical protein COV93_03940 [Candidatus Woesearchaeota archaeon CG11_big_fil_rev_8_21_14_0_20_43_8]|uniref:Uncharacterized protein n=1 Tax=Candidatus Roizmanbacteria bacterium CG22_combo_CG10-13_8_21_14_all_35_9 TaxID=1974861 RepID=A0A2H0BZP0_9BACT|nr:MAG: hypothetical protein COV93_03940 [Candidatus Woesearchaeota archaeon CG11_big_fil_rev_8_21_14_0_20_43_8]PIO05020.1 MAG: hypothetical protein COT47_06565 [Candidatus Woesearchaeota archaeon CG08_land_8_20_14_0_20_43_7]PIP62428.1 MAG: hypothetical protein COW98_04085 [Candidatus Roizmanbacteria bacterium CG22_combo_CG10-13_8_21_14_all_35_9]